MIAHSLNLVFLFVLCVRIGLAIRIEPVSLFDAGCVEILIRFLWNQMRKKLLRKKKRINPRKKRKKRKKRLRVLLLRKFLMKNQR
jgi:hypothetical protein